jgi:hypothetical protein
MKKLLFFGLLIVFSTGLIAQKPNLMSGKYSKDDLLKMLIPHDKWTPFPRINDRAGWSKADPEMMKAAIQRAESYLTYVWPSVPATKSLLIERTGNRASYEAVSFPKRQVLGTLLMAEVFENKGRFMDQIIDGIWSICEESFWGSSAHLPKTKEISGLIDVSLPFVELFSAETATLLSWVDYFVGEKLDAVSPQLRKRIYYEVNYRIFTPLMTKHHGFMGPNENGRRPNNWNPWICSNWLNSVLLLEKDDQKRAEAIAKLLGVLDEFLNPYPQDGGCDEGPGYWGAAAASLYDNVSLLNTATNNSFTYVYSDEKFKNMGKFIYRADISEKYFLNFADASPRAGVAASMVYRYGKDINDPDMMKFGAYFRDPERSGVGRSHFFRYLFELFMQDEFLKAEKGLPLPQDVWLPDLQVMIARDIAGSTKGFFVGAKGGNNDESHNHNDIGNFVIFFNGDPLLIDVGSGTYTRKTFSSQRYEIWSNCSDYHNDPTINGRNQLPGPQFKANNLSYKKDASFAQFTLDISKSYPDDAGIVSWMRTVRLNRGKNVQLTDIYSLKSAGPVTEHFMTCYSAEVLKPGEVVIHFAPEGGKAADFIIKYNQSQFEADVEKVKLENPEDEGVRSRWGDNIRRINFVAKSPKASDKYSFTLQTK